MEHYLDSIEAVQSLERLLRETQQQSWPDDYEKARAILGIKKCIDRIMVMSGRAPKYFST